MTPRSQFSLRLLRASACGIPAACLYASMTMAQTGCLLPSEWIDDAIPDPKELAVSSAFNKLCDFHQWSWNAFLWSMESQGNVLRFETFPTMEQTKNASFDPTSKSDGLQLQLRAGKADHPIDSVAQAGTEGILVAQNNRAIYYSQYVNPQMYQQILDDNWNTAAGLTAESNEALFDVGNIEFKAAWAIVDDEFSVPGAYTRSAQIPQLANITINGVETIGVPQNPTYVDETVALIGLHVVGWVNGHSEAIWSSFSPKGIAPVLQRDDQGNLQPTQPELATATPFFAAGSKITDCNQTQIPVQTLDEATQKLGLTTQACQVYNEGSLLPGDARNAAAVQSINASAAAQLPDSFAAQGYTEVGAIWTISDFRAYCDSVSGDEKPPACNDPVPPTTLQDPSQISGKLNQTFQTMLEGSTVLSNPVIETFTQTDIAQDNCFACHNSLQFQPDDPEIPPLHGSMLNLSHFLTQIYIDTYQPN